MRRNKITFGDHVHSFPCTYHKQSAKSVSGSGNSNRATEQELGINSKKKNGRNFLIFNWKKIWNLCSIRTRKNEKIEKVFIFSMLTRSDWVIETREICGGTNSMVRNRTVAEPNPSSSIIIYWEHFSTWSRHFWFAQSPKNFLFAQICPKIEKFLHQLMLRIISICDLKWLTQKWQRLKRN